MRWAQEQWLLVAAVLVLQLGIAFGVKYSFEQGWLGPWTRVGMGVGLGLALILGSLPRRIAAIAPLAEALFAVGLASLYFSGFAAYSFYGLVPLNVSLGFVAGVALAGGAVAGWRDRPLVGHLAMVGAYLAPVLFATSEDRQVSLFLYLAVVTAGVLVLVWRRPWPAIPPLAALFVVALTTAWFHQHYRAEFLWRSLGLHTVLIGEFLALPFVRLRAGRGNRQVDLTLVTTIAGFALFTVYQHGRMMPDLMLAGRLTLGLAALYAVLGVVLRRFWPGEKGLERLHFALAALMLPIGAEQCFDGSPVTMVLAVEGALLAAIAAWQRNLLLAASSLGAGLIAALRVFLMLDLRGETAGDHARLLATSLFVVAALYYTLNRMNRPRMPAGPADPGPASFHARSWQSMGHLVSLLELVAPLVASVGLYRWIHALALRQGWGDPLQGSVHAVVVTLGGTLLLHWGRAGRRELRQIAACLMTLAGAIAVLFTLASILDGGPVTEWPVLHWPFVWMIASVALLGWSLVVAGQPDTPAAHPLRVIMAIAFVALPLFIACTEWIRVVQYHELGDLSGNAGISILCAAYATLLLMLALRRRSRPLRSTAFALFAFVLAKLFLVDLASLETIYRIVAFLVVGVLLLAGWLLSRRWRDDSSSHDDHETSEEAG